MLLHYYMKAATIIYILLTQILTIIAAANIPAIIVFGDSSVDSGNNNAISTVLKSNFAPYGRDFYGRTPTGRFCNGRLPPDFISEALGLKPIIPAYLDPNYDISAFATGVCFASAGTGYDNATSDVLSVIPLWKEIEYFKSYQTQLKQYLGESTASSIITNALYLISMGTNDFLENYYTLPRRQSQFTPKQYQLFLQGLARDFVVELYTLGARKISLGGLPPMGCLPLERSANIMYGDECVERYNEVAVEFNVKLESLVEKLNRELDGVQIVFSSPYEILLDIIRKPAVYGFQTAATACCATGLYEMSYACNKYSTMTCRDASKYVFWDSFHPTERTNRIVAVYLLRNSLSGFL